ncbi:cilia- and flagella-associated protein 161-like [Cydia splendana]|uniref:cilia- and flagella-associated protein 161-like n=1 Tax=Cydia splendana TaxID=1100963 RepID=UPI00300C64B4
MSRVGMRTDDFAAIMRKRCASLLARIRCSTNGLLSAFADRWDSALMRRWTQLHVSRSTAEYMGIFLGGRISPDEIMYSQELRDGCSVVAHQDVVPQEKHTFVITSADYCNREHEILKYNQEFLLTLSKTVKKKPLYVRFDPNPIPGLCGKFPLFLSEHAVSSTRWRILPVQRPNISRFEQEGKPVPVNEDIIINHCATNINLGVDTGKGESGFYGKIYAPTMKTCLDVFGRELPNNIWHIHNPIPTD